MTNSTLVQTEFLKRQREALQHQRRLKVWQSIWRFLALSGMTGGLVWLVSSPHWVIRDPSQIQIAGNELLSQQQVKDMVAVAYPQSIWQLPLHQLTEQLEAEPPLKTVHITRQLLPTQVKITVQERKPIAKATSAEGVGYLDRTGVWISQAFYNQDLPLQAVQELTVLGFDAKYRERWQAIYPLILASPVKITLIDWRNPSNLILKTELGMVHCGSDGDRFSEQLEVLGKMRKLSSRVPSHRIVYLDVTNPQSPSVKLKP